MIELKRLINSLLIINALYILIKSLRTSNLFYFVYHKCKCRISFN